MKRPWLGALPLVLLLGACAKNINEGQRIDELTEIDEPQKQVPVTPSGPVKPSSEQALDNYRKLLELPQDPATRAETVRRLADLQLDADEAGGASPEQSQQRIQESIALYTLLLNEHPNAPGNDRVLYQLARAHQNTGEVDKAEAALERLIRDYPRSDYVDDARFRRAELLFRLGDFEAAAAEYRRVMDLGEATPFFEQSQYKHGWAMYKLSRHEDALDTFLTILNRELPKGELLDTDAALAGVAAGKKDFAKDALRVTSLALTYLGGGEAAQRYFKQRGEPPYAALLYRNLGETLLEKKRYTDAAGAYRAFIDGHPRHAQAPDFQTRAIAAHAAGGFTELVVQDKERYARLFDPAAVYWTGRTATSEVMQTLRSHLEDLARHHQAKGQGARAAAGATAGAADFVAAAGWYRRLLELFPQDAKSAELRFLMAEALFESGQTMVAAAEYQRVATEFPKYEKAPDAAYAAVLAYQRHASEVAPAQRPAALRQAIGAALALAERYPDHPQAIAALTRAAEDQYRLEAWDDSIKTAARVLQNVSAAEALRRTAWSVTADAQFTQQRFPEAETAYTELLKLTPPAADERRALEERLAASIYKQAEAQRSAGKLMEAAATFLRVGKVLPAAGIRATADYDAAAALITVKAWGEAAAVLEAFRAAHATSTLLPDVDKKLAVAYQSDGKIREASAVLKRIAARAEETPETRREAAWLAVTLLDQAKDPQTEAAYAEYLSQNPPLDRAVEARQRLLALAEARGDAALRVQRLREIVAADKTAGAARTDRSKLAAAKATLELGRLDARRASTIGLTLPLKTSLAPKKEAIERALTTLTHAIEYGFAEVTTAATYELGLLYQDLSRDLLESDRPKKLSALELEQYDLLLEEQAFPFEEKAIAWHEANLKRVGEGLHDAWVGKSLQALALMAPGKYGKREQTAEVYDAVR